MSMKIKEQEISTLIKQGKDSEVVPELYKIVFPQVKRYIVKNNGIEDDAFDVFQDSLLYFYNQVIEGKFNEKYTVFGYLFRLSINRWINKLKRNKRLVFSEDFTEKDYQQLADTDYNQVSLVAENENILEKFFSGIGEKCIELLTYTIYYNLMAEDIVLRMSFASEGAVKMQLKRCKEKLYGEIENNPSLLDKLKGI